MNKVLGIGSRIKFKSVKDINGNDLYGVIADDNFMGIFYKIFCDKECDLSYSYGRIALVLPENVEEVK